MPDLLLEIKSLSLMIQDVVLLNNINLKIHKGEAHILLGENGAGKSTLVKVLSGMHANYTGTITIEGKEIPLTSPDKALSSGIITLQQDTNLFGHLSIAENIFLDTQYNVQSVLHLSKREKVVASQKILDDLTILLDSKQEVRHLNLAQQRMVEFAKISTLTPKLLILDEPGACLDEVGMAIALRVIENLLKKNVSIFYVTHEYKSISHLADFISVMRDGSLIKTTSATNYDSTNISKFIWGENYPDKYPKLKAKLGSETFCVEHLCSNFFKDISFSLYKSEILGITGLVGSGKSNLAKTILGINKFTEGNIYIDRLKADIHSPSAAINLGIAYVTSDLIESGLYLDLCALDNAFALGKHSGRNSIAHTKFEKKQFAKYSHRLNLQVDFNAIPLRFSGGERQKLLLMRWFMSSAKIFIFDEPTNNVDIASKIDIYNLINDLVSKGASVIFISSNIEELTGMCDRILVLRNGSIAYEARRDVPETFKQVYGFMTS